MYSFLKNYRPLVYFFIGPVRIFTYYLDMMKDTVLLIQLVAVVGGMDSILKDPSDFMSAVSFYLIKLMQNIC